MKDEMTFFDKCYPPILEFPDNISDEELFRQAMVQVRPLQKKVKERAGAARKPARWGKIILPRDLLREFLQNGQVEGFERAGYLEGEPREWDRVLLRKLREEEFSVRAELDLHGFSKREAFGELDQFLRQCSRTGVTCVCVIHGKGNNSRNHVPVLKRNIPRWLSTKRLSRYLVAYASARPVDGGLGAIYVLLRRGYRWSLF